MNNTKLSFDLILDGQNLSKTLGKHFSMSAIALIKKISSIVENSKFSAQVILDYTFYNLQTPAVRELLDAGYNVTVYPKAQECNAFGQTQTTGFDHDPYILGLLASSHSENIILGTHDGDYSRVVKLLSNDREIAVFGNRKLMSQQLLKASKNRLIDTSSIMADSRIRATSKSKINRPGKLRIINS